MASAKPGNGTPGAGVAPPPPQGYEKVAAGHDGWVCFLKHKPIHGRIVGYQPRHDQDGFEYLLELIEDSPGKDGDEIIAHPKGRIVAMNETAQLEKVLREYVENKAIVWICPLEKVKSGRGSVWLLDIRVKGTKGNLPRILGTAAGEKLAPAPF